MPHEKGQGAAFSFDNLNHSWLGAVELATVMLERVISQLRELVGFALGTRNLHMPIALSVLLVLAGYYAGSISEFSFGLSPSGIGATWPPTAILLAALLLAPPRYWWMYLLGVVPAHLHVVANFQLPEVPFVVMLCQVGSNILLAVLAALALRLFDRRSASARQPPQHGRIHPSSGSGDSCRERGGSLAIPAHWLGRGLLARVASAGPRKRVLHHHDPSCDCSGVRRSVGWGARDPEILFGTRSHHGGCARRGYPGLWSGVHRDPRLCPPCCWLLCRF